MQKFYTAFRSCGLDIFYVMSCCADEASNDSNSSNGFSPLLVHYPDYMFATGAGFEKTKLYA